MTKRVSFAGYDCELEWERYGNGRPAISLVDDEGPVAVATVNLPEARLAPGEVLIKDYSENEGMLEALVRAGVVEDTGRRVPSGFVELPVARLLEQPLEHDLAADHGISLRIPFDPPDGLDRLQLDDAIREAFRETWPELAHLDPSPDFHYDGKCLVTEWNPGVPAPDGRADTFAENLGAALDRDRHPSQQGLSRIGDSV